ncbi:Rho termination factor N-terminal domain-containing protein [Acetivibrio cellulolyticus]|uniref:Rho termination factor N-terminal domain-containing protein n=1 Tax=Acetivibrio cellulolyticus TaxID=35830 RepID=UPI0001E2C29C|nr:Rho termination factor N-terminal domain-containing protein [Acetivibrio cellulolyticus]
MFCEKCNSEFTSEKIYFIHVSECKTEYKKENYSDIDYTELKKIASEKGINTHGMKKQEIIEALGGINNDSK